MIQKHQIEMIRFEPKLNYIYVSQNKKPYNLSVNFIVH